MNKTIIAAVIATSALIPTFAAAHDREPHRFTRDGETYVYTTTIKGDVQVIDGYRATGGARFHLVVRNGVVSGVTGGQAVDFRVDQAGSVGLIETASR